MPLFINPYEKGKANYFHFHGQFDCFPVFFLLSRPLDKRLLSLFLNNLKSFQPIWDIK